MGALTPEHVVFGPGALKDMHIQLLLCWSKRHCNSTHGNLQSSTLLVSHSRQRSAAHLPWQRNAVTVETLKWKCKGWCEEAVHDAFEVMLLKNGAQTMCLQSVISLSLFAVAGACKLSIYMCLKPHAGFFFFFV